MITATESLERLEDVLDSGELSEVCRKHHVDLLVLFGSSLNQPDPGDIDLGVAFKPDAKHFFLEFVDELAGLVPGDHLDVMSLDSAGPVAMQRALVAPRVLYAATPRAFYDRQTFAINHYIDTQHLRDALLRSLTG